MDNRIDPTAAPTDPAIAPLSPTGTPKMSPRVVPWVLMIGAVAGLELCAHSAPAPYALFCQVGAVALGAALGIASPGWRK